LHAEEVTQLNINIDEEARKLIESSGQYVTLAKKSDPYRGGFSLAWITFKPSTQNTISWSETYFLFQADASSVSGGATLMPQWNETEAGSGSSSEFINGHFSPIAGGGDGYKMVNRNNRLEFYGLAQKAVLNGKTVGGPVNGFMLPPYSTLQLHPSEIVSIFLSSTAKNGTVIDGPPDDALSVAPKSGSSTFNIAFDKAKKVFKLQP